MGKPVAVRLDDETTKFLELVRGELTLGQTLKGFAVYLRQFDPNYAKRILHELAITGKT